MFSPNKYDDTIQIVALLKIANISKQAFLSLKLFMGFHWGWRMFASRIKVGYIRKKINTFHHKMLQGE